MNSRDAILNLYEQGYSKDAICRTLDKAPAAVGKVLTEAGFHTEDYHKMEPELKRIVFALLPHHVSYKDIEEYCDVSADAIRDLVARMGYRRGKCYRTYLSVSNDELSFPAFPEFVRRYEAGESFPALIKELGVSDDKVYPLWWYAWAHKLSGIHRDNLSGRVEALLEEDLPATAIAHRLHISPSIVRRVSRCRC